MKKKKLLLATLFCMLLTLSFASLSQAVTTKKFNYKKNVTLLYAPGCPSLNNQWLYEPTGNIRVEGTGSLPWHITSKKSSNSGVVAFGKNISICTKKAGKATLKVTADNGYKNSNGTVTYGTEKWVYNTTLNVTVKKVAFPVASISFGGKNLLSQVKKEHTIYVSKNKKSVTGKLNVKAAKGWKILKIEYGAKSLKSGAKVTLKPLSLNDYNTPCCVTISFMNTATKQVFGCTITCK